MLLRRFSGYDQLLEADTSGKEIIKMRKIAITLFLLSFGFFLASGTASAAETTLSDILNSLYGLGNLQRVDDASDQIWNPADSEATAQAKFAAFSQNFGYIPQKDGMFNSADYVSLFNVPGGTNGIDNLAVPTAALSSGPVNFLWALDPSGAPLWTSLPDQNSDLFDHMVTWKITGNAGEGNENNPIGNFVIAWEDLKGGGDRDFNDLVVEVTAAPVPIPAAILLLGSGIVGLAGIPKKFKL